MMLMKSIRCTTFKKNLGKCKLNQCNLKTPVPFMYVFIVISLTLYVNTACK